MHGTHGVGKFLTSFCVAVLLFSAVFGVASADPGITPSTVERLIFPGEASVVGKTVGTPEFPPKLDVCLLEDETGSFSDDIANLQAAASALYDSIVAVAPDSQFGVHGFRDYPVDPYGDAGDWVHRKLSNVSPNKADWLAGVALLTAAGGNDEPEAQFDAIVAATQGADACEWRADPDVTRVLVVATDAPFHGPDGTHMNDSAATTAVLTGNNVRVIGLKAPGAGAELDVLAGNTGGSVQALSSDGSNIATAILAGLGNLPATVVMQSNCAAPIGTGFVPPSDIVTSGDDAQFVETISVAAGAAGGTYLCSDSATVNGDPLVDAGGNLITEDKTIHVPGIDVTPDYDENELGFDPDHTVYGTVTAGNYGPVPNVRVDFEVTAGPNTGPTGSDVTDVNGQTDFTYGPPVVPASLGSDTIQGCFTNADASVVYGCDSVIKDWVDTTPPDAFCTPTVNPHGGNEPTAPGNGGQGQNQDGFYQISAVDVVWPADTLQIFVTDGGSGTVFGPFPVSTRIKYVEDPEGTPESHPMGGNNKGGGGEGAGSTAVDWFIKGTGDALVTAVDGSSNVSVAVSCLVPPPPK